MISTGFSCGLYICGDIRYKVRKRAENTFIHSYTLTLGV